MFAPSRDEVRQFFAEVWHKRRAGEPLSALESQASEIIEHHPEYHDLLADPVRWAEGNEVAPSGSTSPFLHLSLHLAIEEQISIDQPPGIRRVYQRLCLRLRDEHEARHRLLESLGEVLWRAQSQGGTLDADLYSELLQRL